jgi:acyl carrier protein
MISLEELKAIVAGILQVGDRLDSLGADSALLGGIPEFDSMAVVSILTTIEESYGVMIDDDEISAEVFETLGSLLEFVNGKLA